MKNQKNKILVHLTDTCYGFAVPFDDLNGIKKIIEIKKRPEGKMFSLLFYDLEQVKKYCFINKEQEKFILENSFYSSFILKKKDILKNFSPEFKTVCIRIENGKFDFCPVKNDFFENGKKPVTTTSVNISGEKEFYDRKRILEKFGKFSEIKIKISKNFLKKEKKLFSSEIFDLTKIKNDEFLKIR